MTRFTVTDLAGLRRELEIVHAQGYAVNDQEAFLGDLSVAAPLRDPQGRPLGAVNIAVPTPRWKLEEVMARLVPPLVRTAAETRRKVRRRIGVLGSVGRGAARPAARCTLCAWRIGLQYGIIGMQ